MAERRTRRQCQHFEPEFNEKKQFVVEPGTGTPLREIPHIVENFKKLKSADRGVLLPELHRLFFGRPGNKKTQSKNILQFSGFPEEEHDVIIPRRKAKVMKYSMPLLKRLMDLLGINRSAKSFESGKANKNELAQRFINWITCPIISDANVDKAKKRVSKRKNTSSKAKGKTDAEDNSTTEAPAQKKGSNKSANRRAHAKTQSVKRRRWFAASENMLSGGKSTNTAPSKKRKRPAQKKSKAVKTDVQEVQDNPELIEIRNTIFKILEVVDKTKVTMKLLRKQAEKELGKDLIQYKKDIKIIVQEYFSK